MMLAWRQALNDGLVKKSGFKSVSGAVERSRQRCRRHRGNQSGYEVRFLQDWKLYDGRFATSGWLQELPDPLTKIVWDNAALVSPKDAANLGVGIGDMLKITVGGASVEIPAFVLPGQPIGVIGLALGYGRTLAEHIGSDVGVNTYAAAHDRTRCISRRRRSSKTGGYYDLATTQDHHLFDTLGIEQRQEQVGDKVQERRRSSGRRRSAEYQARSGAVSAK